MPVLQSLRTPGAFVKNSFYYFYYIFYSLLMATSKRKKLTIVEKVKTIQEVEWYLKWYEDILLLLMLTALIYQK
jgi:hypothetical protein